jgi:hypothetical protein
LAYELVPVRAILLGSCVEFFDDGGGRIDGGDVGNLTSELLMLSAYTAIGINHNIFLLPFLAFSP